MWHATTYIGVGILGLLLVLIVALVIYVYCTQSKSVLRRVRSERALEEGAGAGASVPEEHRSVPEEHRSVPEEHRSVPEEHRSVPEEHRSVPEEHRSVPDEQRGVIVDFERFADVYDISNLFRLPEELVLQFGFDLCTIFKLQAEYLLASIQEELNFPLI